jgi:hypothetical protein
VASARETYWPLGKVAFSLLPLSGTYTRRATVMEEVVPGTVWTMDQIQGVVNVNVPVRMVVIKVRPFVMDGMGWDGMGWDGMDERANGWMSGRMNGDGTCESCALLHIATLSTRRRS